MMTWLKKWIDDREVRESLIDSLTYDEKMIAITLPRMYKNETNDDLYIRFAKAKMRGRAPLFLKPNFSKEKNKLYKYKIEI